MSYGKELKEIFEKYDVSENAQVSLKELAAKKFELSDYEEALCALGFVEGYVLCLKEHAYYDQSKVYDLIKASEKILYILDGNMGVVNHNSTAHLYLKKKLSELCPVTYFNFDQKMEVVIGHLIEYCRKLEKEEKGKGYSVLQEIAPTTNVYDAVMACLKYPDAKVEFKGTKYCGESDCRESEFANGYCKKHANI